MATPSDVQFQPDDTARKRQSRAAPIAALALAVMISPETRAATAKVTRLHATTAEKNSWWIFAAAWPCALAAAITQSMKPSGPQT